MVRLSENLKTSLLGIETTSEKLPREANLSLYEHVNAIGDILTGYFRLAEVKDHLQIIINTFEDVTDDIHTNNTSAIDDAFNEFVSKISEAKTLKTEIETDLTTIGGYATQLSSLTNISLTDLDATINTITSMSENLEKSKEELKFIADNFASTQEKIEDIWAIGTGITTAQPL